MRKLSILAVMAATSLFATPAMSAVTYNLSSDFSNINNPNGVWSFTQGATAFAHYPIPITPNALNVAAADGYWGTGPGFNTAPFVIKTTSNGSAAVGYDNNAFLTGDVATLYRLGAHSFLLSRLPRFDSLGLTRDEYIKRMRTLL